MGIPPSIAELFQYSKYTKKSDLGVLEWQPSSELAIPLLIQPKKNKTVCFLTNFQEVNKTFVVQNFDLLKFIVSTDTVFIIN